jgi:hypothetical protein
VLRALDEVSLHCDEERGGKTERCE